MATPQLSNLLPEIFPIIAAQLPLYATPSTLLALALTNHHISEIVLPLVYSRLVLKNEKHAMLVLQKLMDDPPFGLVVRELHVMSDLAPETRSQDPPLDVIRRITDIILKGYLPFIHTLGLNLGSWWYYDDRNNFEPVKGFGRPGKEFWSQIKEKCPRLCALILDGFRDDPEEPWLEDSGLLQVPGITSLSVHIVGYTLQPSASQKLLLHVASLAPSLHTLNLKPECTEFESTSSIFELDFPCLRSLSLASFSEVNPLQAMAFWERHPSLEYLDIASNSLDRDSHWVTSPLPGNLLPNLLHLRVHWNDALVLAPILDRLSGLSIHGSVNAQIPYLLRSICLNGLPTLKSLDIGQAPSSNGRNKNIEGSLWYENSDGTFQRATNNKASRTVFDSFMHSIVRAAPNLEEIGFHGARFPLSDFIQIADDLNGFIHLKHLYYEEYYSGESGSIPLHDMRDTFGSQARDLAESVPALVSITNVASLTQPYMTARITRGESGRVAGVDVGNGYGMKIGYQDEAFPWAPHDST